MIMNRLALAAGLALFVVSTAAPAAEISTHVLDLARGIGGGGVPVVLLKKSADGRWIEVGRARSSYLTGCATFTGKLRVERT